jgi:hypothetical protein
LCDVWDYHSCANGKDLYFHWYDAFYIGVWVIEYSEELGISIFVLFPLFWN